jgi:hypothetical protein
LAGEQEQLERLAERLAQVARRAPEQLQLTVIQHTVARRRGVWPPRAAARVDREQAALDHPAEKLGEVGQGHTRCRVAGTHTARCDAGNADNAYLAYQVVDVVACDFSDWPRGPPLGESTLHWLQAVRSEAQQSRATCPAAGLRTRIFLDEASGERSEGISRPLSMVDLTPPLGGHVVADDIFTQSPLAMEV